MFIDIGIYVEIFTLLKHIVGGPITRRDWTETREQHYTTENVIDWNNGGFADTVLEGSRNSIHAMVRVRCVWKASEPFNISEVLRDFEVSEYVLLSPQWN